MIPRKQIGWSQEENLLWEISRQLDRMFLAIRTEGVTITTSSTTTTTTTAFSQTCTETPVTIGTQIWDKCNLNVSTYRNGDVIPQVTDPTQWFNLTTGAWCHYNNDPANDAIYGKLYNWYAVNDPRGLAPIGKHVPTDPEWITLVSFLGGDSVAGGKMKETGTTFWSSPNTGATNESGFTGLGGGYRVFSFFDINNVGSWWSSTENVSQNAWYYTLFFSDGSVFRSFNFKEQGFSVRCLID